MAKQTKEFHFFMDAGLHAFYLDLAAQEATSLSAMVNRSLRAYKRILEGKPARINLSNTCPVHHTAEVK